MEEQQDQLLDHDYDGIQEYDNPLPRWWVWLFYGTIIFGVFYLGYYHLFGGPGMIDEYQAEVAQAEAQAQKTAEAQATIPTPTDGASGAPQSAPAPAVADANAGKAVYMSYCASCHGQKGEGGIGPNLTDNYWLHGNQTADLIRVITEGVPTKGMVAWKSILNPKKTRDVAAYIQSLAGTTPPNAKEPQGKAY